MLFSSFHTFKLTLKIQINTGNNHCWLRQSNITGCQVPSGVKVLFDDSACDTDFYPMFPSQSESIFFYMKYNIVN